MSSITEIHGLLWFIGILLSVIAFIGVVFVNYFIQMARDVSAIKTSIEVHRAKHEGLEKRVEILEEKISNE